MPTPIQSKPDQEALIASFEAEGYPHDQAKYKAYRFRQAFVPGTPMAELLRRREVALAHQAVVS